MKRLFALFCLWLGSCTAPIDLDVTAEEPRLVIFGVLTDTQEHQTIRLQSTVPYTDGSDSYARGVAEAIRSAEVMITSSRGTVYPTEYNSLNDFFRTRDALEIHPGLSYDLDVRCDFNRDGFPERYTATTRVLPPAGPDSLSVTPISMPMMDENRIYKFSIYGRDPAGPNWYIYRLRVDGELRNNVNQWIFGDDGFYDGSPYSDYPLVMLTNPVDEEPLFYEGVEVDLLTSNVEEDFALFISEVMGSEGGEMPLFGGPPYNVRTNITGGALGFFGNLYSTEISAIVQ